jgi:hypothetical protein
LDQTNWESVNAKDILALKGVGIVAAQHVLVAQEIGEDGQQGMPDLGFSNLQDAIEQEPQSQQLAIIEHFSVLCVAPAMEPKRLIAMRNQIARDGKARFSSS